MFILCIIVINIIKLKTFNLEWHGKMYKIKSSSKYINIYYRHYCYSFDITVHMLLFWFFVLFCWFFFFWGGVTSSKIKYLILYISTIGNTETCIIISNVWSMFWFVNHMSHRTSRSIVFFVNWLYIWHIYFMLNKSTFVYCFKVMVIRCYLQKSFFC